MGLQRSNPATERTERRAMIALLAVFVLLVQALAPSLAMAAPMTGDGIMICNDQGLQPASDLPSDPKASGPCDHCVCPPAVAALAAQGGVAFAYVRVAAAVERTATPAKRWPPARAPPRPPGQGPPALQA